MISNTSSSSMIRMPFPVLGTCRSQNRLQLDLEVVLLPVLPVLQLYGPQATSSTMATLKSEVLRLSFKSCSESVRIMLSPAPRQRGKS